MKRWWLAIALLLSLGVNVGILATLAMGRAGRAAAYPDHGPHGVGGEAGPPPVHPGWPGGPGGAGIQGEPGGEVAGEPGGEPFPPRLERLADHLGLAGDQRQRFLALQRRMLVEVAEAQRRRGRAAAELRRELGSENPDPDRVHELIGDGARAAADLETATARTILETRQLLDGEAERRYLEVIAHLRAARGGGPLGHRRPGLR